MAPPGGVHLGMRGVMVATLFGMLVWAPVGCGNWSNEDFLFANAIPNRTLLALRLPGAEDVGNTVVSGLNQGLNDACALAAEQDAITCTARGVAQLFNRITFGLLGAVEHISRQQPSKRRVGIRVWGPWFDSGANRTLRFEMRRDRSVGAGGFRYCLHLAAGKRTGLFVDNAVACGKDAAGFVEVFSGTFLPDEENEATGPRVGVGTIRLDLTKQRNAGLADPTNLRSDGVFEFDYDTTGGQQTIGIVLTQVANQDTGLPSDARYTYHRTAEGAGLMKLLVVQVSAELASLALDARWNSDGASRVDATGVGPQSPTEYHAFECTNAQWEIVTRHYDWAPQRELPTGGADVGLCPIGLLPP